MDMGRGMEMRDGHGQRHGDEGWVDVINCKQM